MKITVLDGAVLAMDDVSWAPLEALGELTVYDRTAPEELLLRAKGSPVLFTNKTPLRREIIEQLPGLRYIGVLATGYDVVDVAAAKERGVPVCNVPTYGTDSVAQLCWSLILEHFMAVGAHGEFVKAGGWQRCPDYSAPVQTLTELAGKTIGIVGLGKIGRRVADIALAFGLRVLAYDTAPAPHPGCRLVGLSQLYAEADIISLHCYLTEENRGMINGKTIAQMKPTALIVNTARGGLINEADLLAALQAGRIGGAALDVLSTEPPKEGNILINAPRTIVTPHIAWGSLEARRRLMEIAADNLRAFIERGEAKNCVYGGVL